MEMVANSKTIKMGAMSLRNDIRGKSVLPDIRLFMPGLPVNFLAVPSFECNI
jgi:hypothetical protein